MRRGALRWAKAEGATLEIRGLLERTLDQSGRGRILFDMAGAWMVPLREIKGGRNECEGLVDRLAGQLRPHRDLLLRWAPKRERRGM